MRETQLSNTSEMLATTIEPMSMQGYGSVAETLRNFTCNACKVEVFVGLVNGLSRVFNFEPTTDADYYVSLLRSKGGIHTPVMSPVSLYQYGERKIPSDLKRYNLHADVCTAEHKRDYRAMGVR